MIVREAEEYDLPALLFLYAQLHQLPLEEKPTPEIKALWQRMLQDENQHVLVAEDGGVVVSSCVLVVVPNLTHGQRPYAFVENVVTHSAHRGRGYASAVLQHARGIAKQENCYKIMLLTGRGDEKTLRFYEQAGFNKHDKTGFVLWLE